MDCSRESEHKHDTFGFMESYVRLYTKYNINTCLSEEYPQEYCRDLVCKMVDHEYTQYMTEER